MIALVTLVCFQDINAKEKHQTCFSCSNIFKMPRHLEFIIWILHSLPLQRRSSTNHPASIPQGGNMTYALAQAKKLFPIGFAIIEEVLLVIERFPWIFHLWQHVGICRWIMADRGKKRGLNSSFVWSIWQMWKEKCTLVTITTVWLCLQAFASEKRRLKK